MRFKVCILAAGAGTRSGYADIIHKALLPIGYTTVLSRIIEKFESSTEIVIAVGAKAEQIEDYISIAHPDRPVKTVVVDRWQGQGTGPGYSLLQCRPYLDCPFIFTSCDTIVMEDVPEPGYDWVGVAGVEDPEPYCMVAVNDRKVSGFWDKVDPATFERAHVDGKNICLDHAFIGMAGVFNIEAFFSSLENGNKVLRNEEWQVASGLAGLLPHNLTPIPFTWHDTGTTSNYEKTRDELSKCQVLPKISEFTFIENGKVIKFYKDPEIVTQRVTRAEKLAGLVPEISDLKKNFYAYQYVPGKLLSEVTDNRSFKNMLETFKKNLWRPLHLDLEERNHFYAVCRKFYEGKTKDRVKMLLSMNEIDDHDSWINGEMVPSLADLINQIHWDDLCHGQPVLFHGDFQPENIVFGHQGRCLLIDWRQAFGSITNYGDIYYDFAKLYHALIVNGEVVRNNQFSTSVDSHSHAFYNFLVPSNLMEFREIFKEFIEESGYSWKKVEILGTLVFANIAPLHHQSYCEFLYFLSRRLLHRILKEYAQ